MWHLHHRSFIVVANSAMEDSCGAISQLQEEEGGQWSKVSSSEGSPIYNDYPIGSTEGDSEGDQRWEVLTNAGGEVFAKVMQGQGHKPTDYVAAETVSVSGHRRKSANLQAACFSMNCHCCC